MDTKAIKSELINTNKKGERKGDEDLDNNSHDSNMAELCKTVKALQNDLVKGTWHF